MHERDTSGHSFRVNDRFRADFHATPPWKRARIPSSPSPSPSIAPFPVRGQGNILPTSSRLDDRRLARSGLSTLSAALITERESLLRLSLSRCD